MLEVAREADQSQPRGGAAKKARVTKSHRLSEVERSVESTSDREPAKAKRPVLVNHLASTPIITGEAHYKGMIPVDGIIVGHHGAKGGSLEIPRRSLAAPPLGPQLSGEFTFRDIVRINGHIAGTVHSEKGTLIVDSGAAVDADVDVAVALIKGIVNGDIVAQERVELSFGSKVCGTITTRSLTVEDGADFEGACSILVDS